MDIYALSKVLTFYSTQVLFNISVFFFVSGACPRMYG